MRDNINVNTSLKLFESYRNFSGGLNVQQSNEEMRDNQSTIAENVDLALTHSIRKRTGRTALAGTIGWTATSPIQGLYKFVNNAETVLIAAVEGKLWYARPSGMNYGNWIQIPITDSGSAFTFQTTDTVEAAQYGDWLYVATGTKLVRCQVYQNGSNVTVTNATTIVDDYKPTAQEALYVGLNSINSVPTAYLTDLTTGVAGTISALGIGFDGSSFTIGQSKTLTAYVKTANPAPSVDYQWSYRVSGTTTWLDVPNYHPWSTAYKSASFIMTEPNTYDVKVEVRLTSASAVNDTYIWYGIKVNATAQPPLYTSSNIQKCRRILLHWDRLIVYDPKPSATSGVVNEQDRIYISDLKNPLYFPTPNVISFAGDTQQHIRKVVQYRNILLVFTPDTVQSLTGKSPADYVRSIVNSQIGAIWSESVQVVENEVYFVSKQSVYSIRPNMYIQDNFNVKAIDLLVHDLFDVDFIDSDAVSEQYNATAGNQVVSALFDNQYWLYTRNGIIYRYYFELRCWASDTTDHLGDVKFGTPIIASFNDNQMLIEPIYRKAVGSSTYASAFVGADKSVYTDAGVPYTMKLRTKYFDLSLAFNYKKLRKLYVITRLQGSNVNLGVTVQADTAVVLDAEQGSVVVDSTTGAVSWQINTVPNLIFYSGTSPQPYLGSAVGSWISGTTTLGEITLAVLHANIRAKCRRVRLTFEHSDGSPCEVYGFGLEFRAKRP